MSKSNSKKIVYYHDLVDEYGLSWLQLQLFSYLYGLAAEYELIAHNGNGMIIIEQEEFYMWIPNYLVYSQDSVRGLLESLHDKGVIEMVDNGKTVSITIPMKVVEGWGINNELWDIRKFYDLLSPDFEYSFLSN